MVPAPSLPHPGTTSVFPLSNPKMWEEHMLSWDTSDTPFVLRYEEDEDDYEGGYDDFEEDDEMNDDEDLDDEDVEDDEDDEYDEYDDYEDEFYEDDEPKPGKKRGDDWD